MFFSDRAKAIGEMARVLRPGGRVGVATWAAVEELPGFAAMVDLFGAELGDWAADAMRAPFSIGTAEALGDLLRPSFPDVAVTRREAWPVSVRSTTGSTARSAAGRSPSTSTMTSTSACVSGPPKGWRDSSAPTAW